MAKRGTKPAPTALKLLKNAQPCRVNRAEPTPPPGAPERPDYVTGAAAELWKELAPILTGMGVLTVADRHALAFLCDSYRRWRDDPDDQKRRDEFRRTLAEFGLTPSSRSGIKSQPQPPADPLADFLSRGRA